MPIRKQSERQALTKILSKYAVGPVDKAAIYLDAMRIVKHAKIIGRCDLRRCNDPMDEAEATANDKRDDESFARIVEILRTRYHAGIKVHPNGDPRGYPVKLDLPDGERNEWGGQYGIGEE